MTDPVAEKFPRQWRENDRVDYVREPLRGECLPFASDLDLPSLPWDSARGLSVKGDEVVACVKRSRSRCVLTFKARGPGGATARVYAKRCLARKRVKRWISWARSSKCRREWDLGWSLLHRELPTALPMLWADERGPTKTLKASYLVTLGIERSTSFLHAWRGLSSEQEKAQWLHLLGGFIRASHEKGFAHDDLSAEHILVTADSIGKSKNRRPCFYFIDLDQSRLTKRRVGGFRRAHNFFQIFRSMPPDIFTQIHRRAFYAGYSGITWNEKDFQKVERLVGLIARWKEFQKLFKVKTWIKPRP